MTLRLCGLLIAVLSSSRAAPPPAAARATGVHYDFVMRVQMPERTAPGDPDMHPSTFPSTIQGEIWRAGSSMRLDVKMGADQNRFQILTPTALYTLMPSTKRGVRTELIGDAVRTLLAQGSPFVLATPVVVKRVWPNAKLAGKDRINGVECDVWVTYRAGRSPNTVRIWMPLSKKPVSPLKMEILTQVGAPGSPSAIGTPQHTTRTLELLKVTPNQAVPNSIFAVPPDYKIVQRRGSPLQELEGSRRKQ